MKTFLVAALFAASAAIASPPPTKAPTDTRGPVNPPATGTLETPTGDGIQADPHAPAKTEGKTEAATETAPSGRTEAMMQGTDGTKKPVKAPASKKSAK
ncbi:hypothetical protein [Corallococcus sp. AB038B]|uniref:hypothetical protein n=1 Tax=Corallococcus sp. AB038B TaxID=2316718 RepID=UPI000EE8512F|nr:hypothetical protein [Corallococcus sp. AB038B]RKI04343.1 hypothetical protein D7Y04_05260 [Corallococcus sp. AB038B]